MYTNSALTFQDDDSEKYPAKIQKLFNPRLPFLYKKPTDYPPEKRGTANIGPLSQWKLEIEKYREQYRPEEILAPVPAKSKKQLHEESLDRQLAEWNDAEAFSKNEFVKDPYRTVFVARIYYSLTELDLSKHFTKYGSIESIRIIRDTQTGQSRGYGFVVFERDSDAKNCIRELASTGLAVDPPAGSKSRKILVDMERGRLVRSWLPRRLGGGLGGRGYTQISAHHSRDASAASSGRRMNLSSNPYQQSMSPSRYPPKRPHTDRFTANKKPAHDLNFGTPQYGSTQASYGSTQASYGSTQASYGSTESSYASTQAPYGSSQYGSSQYGSNQYGSTYGSTPAAHKPSPAAYKPSPAPAYGSVSSNGKEYSSSQSIKDKYAKYQSLTDSKLSGDGRSIRSIRQRD